MPMSSDETKPLLNHSKTKEEASEAGLQGSINSDVVITVSNNEDALSSEDSADNTAKYNQYMERMDIEIGLIPFQLLAAIVAGKFFVELVMSKTGIIGETIAEATTGPFIFAGTTFLILKLCEDAYPATFRFRDSQGNEDHKARLLHCLKLFTIASAVFAGLNFGNEYLQSDNLGVEIGKILFLAASCCGIFHGLKALFKFTIPVEILTAVYISFGATSLAGSNLVINSIGEAVSQLFGIHPNQRKEFNAFLSLIIAGVLFTGIYAIARFIYSQSIHQDNINRINDNTEPAYLGKRFANLISKFSDILCCRSNISAQREEDGVPLNTSDYGSIDSNWGRYKAPTA